MSTLIGSTVGEYRIDSLIGEGTAGRVYRATHTFLGHVVALKILYDTTRGPGFKSRFFEHAQGVTGLTHPNVARVYHYGEDQNTFYIATELVNGGSLETVFSDQPAAQWNSTYWSAVDSVLQAADGLSVVHSKGLVHGGIKPSNLLLARGEEGATVTKVTDIGVAQLLSESDPAKDSPFLYSAYAPPEQRQGTLPDQRSDIYCLGAILYELTTRRAVFRAQAAAGSGSSQTSVKPPRQVMQDFPTELEAIILKCLSVEPRDRFANARDLTGALRVVLDKYGYYGAQTKKAAVASHQPMPSGLSSSRPPSPPPPPTGPNPSKVPCVQVLDGSGAVIETRFMSGAGITIGSAPVNDIILRSDQIAERHVRLDWDGHNVSTTDLGSAGGTLLDNHLLLPQIAHPWMKEKWVRIGPYFIWLHLPGDGPGPRALIDVVLDQNGKNMTLIPGRESVCRVTLVNRKGQVDAAYVTIEGMPEQWVEGDNRDIHLQPYERNEIELTINVPKAASSLAKDYDVRIKANSRAQPGEEQGSTDATWTVAAFDKLSMEVSPSKGSGWTHTQYNVAIHNDSNHGANCVVTASAEEKQLDLKLLKEGDRERTRLELDLPWDRSGTKVLSKLKVKVPRKWIGSSVPHPITVQAVPGEGKPALVDEAEFLQRAIFAPWMLIVAPVLLIGLIFLVGYMGKPQVPLLSVEPPMPAVRTPVTIRWDAHNASHVEVLVNDLAVPNLIPTTKGFFTFRDGFEKDFRIKITGGNIFGDAQAKDITVTVVHPVAPLAEIQMNVSKTQIKQGDSVVITWKVTGASSVDFNLKGTVGTDGSYTDFPTGNQTYTITALNADRVPATRSFPVTVTPLGPPSIDPKDLKLTVSTTKASVGDTVVFTWAAPNAMTARIDAISQAQLTGNEGQKAVQFKGKGLYQFTLVATDANNKTFRSSPPIQIKVDCSFFRTVKLKCSDDLGLQWAN